jgi:hypothetical protein
VWWAMQTCRCLPISTVACRRACATALPSSPRPRQGEGRLATHSFLDHIDRHSFLIYPCHSWLALSLQLCAHALGAMSSVRRSGVRLLYVFASTSTSNSSPEDTAARESSPFCTTAPRHSPRQSSFPHAADTFEIGTNQLQQQVMRLLPSGPFPPSKLGAQLTEFRRLYPAPTGLRLARWKPKVCVEETVAPVDPAMCEARLSCSLWDR